MRKELQILPQRRSASASGPAAAALAAAPRLGRCFGERPRFVQPRAGEAMAVSFDIASVSSTNVRQMHAHWEQVRGARLMPARGDIDPSAIKPLLPYIVIAEVFHDPLRVRYRLVGTAVVEHSRFDYTGKWLHEVDFGEPHDWIAIYEVFVRQKRPLFGHSEIPFEDNVRPPQPYEFCMLPLSADGATVTGMLSLEDYGALSSLDRGRVGKVKAR